MAEPRRIVPDASVLIKAYFREEFTDRAKSVRAAIDTKSCVAFAPEMLQAEFFTNAFEKASGRGRPERVPHDELLLKVVDFFALPIIYVPGVELRDIALECVESHGVPPPDSWYVACARYYDAELWISHDHADGLATSARQFHDKVFLLSERAFT